MSLLNEIIKMACTFSIVSNTMVLNLDEEIYHSSEVKLMSPLPALDLQMTMQECFDNHVRGSVIDTMHNVLEFYDNPLFLTGAGIRRLYDHEMGGKISEFITNNTRYLNEKHFSFIVNVIAKPLPTSST